MSLPLEDLAWGLFAKAPAYWPYLSMQRHVLIGKLLIIWSVPIRKIVAGARFVAKRRLYSLDDWKKVTPMFHRWLCVSSGAYCMRSTNKCCPHCEGDTIGCYKHSSLQDISCSFHWALKLIWPESVVKLVYSTGYNYVLKYGL